MPWEDKEAGLWNPNQPLPLTSLTGYLLEPDVILYLHPSRTLGHTWVSTQLFAEYHSSVPGKSRAHRVSVSGLIILQTIFL